MQLKTFSGCDPALAGIWRHAEALAIESCYIGPDAPRQLARFATWQCGGRCLMLSDENTQPHTEPLKTALSAARMTIQEHVYGREPVDATEDLGQEVVKAAERCAFILAVGSGTLCDLAKYAGTEMHKPVVLYGTAASMNGYTSGIVALKVRGLKRTLPCRPAVGVFINPEVLATAPARMTAAGVADFLSKTSATADWRAADLLREDYFSDQALVFYRGVVERVLDAAPAAGRGEPDALGRVAEALLLSGLSMLAAGSSAPASGGEHLISHYLDMKSALYGISHDLHGIQVGVATVHCIKLWEKILALEPDDIDIERLLAMQPEEAQIDAWIQEDWGGGVGEEVRRQWEKKRLGTEALREELARCKNEWPALRKAIRGELLPSSVLETALEAAGAPIRPEDLTAPLDEYQKALERARYIRDRFTVLDLAVELGVA